MSYILDALKRSERDRRRNRNDPPTIRSIHSGKGGQKKSYAHLGVVLLASAAFGVLLAGAYWLWTPGSVEQPSGMQAKADGESSLKRSQGAESRDAKDAVMPVQPERPRSSAPETQGRILELWELGPAEQRFIDQLDISMHVYSAQPAQRTVLINGLRLREGQMLGNDLRLVEITPDALIVTFQGKWIRVPVGSAW